MAAAVRGDSGMGSRRGDESGVQATNDDAVLSKLAAARKGYLPAGFLPLFVRRPVKRSPLINRGYYARWAAIRSLIDRFLDTPGGGARATEGSGDAGECSIGEGGQTSGQRQVARRQVVSLGAGFDTAFFDLQQAGRAPAAYLELDFPEVTRRKAAIIAARPELLAVLGGEGAVVVDAERGSVHSRHYHLVPADIRCPQQLDEALAQSGLSAAVPTLLLAECVLVYLPPDNSEALLAWAAATFSTSAFLAYDPFRGNDAFGEQMLANLEARGAPLRGMAASPDVAAVEARLRAAGWERAEARDMLWAYERLLDRAEVRRIERLEPLDEVEEWRLIMAHYCIALAVKDPSGRELASLRLDG